MRIEDDIKLDFKDVLIKPKRSTLSSRKDVDLFRDFKFPHSSQTFKRIPIISSNMYGTGTIEMAKKLHDLGLMCALHKFYDVDTLVEFFKGDSASESTFFTIGMAENDYVKLSELKNRIGTPNLICIDVANGYTERFSNYVERIRSENSDAVIMAGNVCTPEMTEELILRGADIVKVGIGNGGVCTTRNVTGVGVPQLSAIIECADAAHGLGGHICCDGGMREIADFSIAFGAGSDFIMVGSMFSGHDECNGEIVEVAVTDPITGEKISKKHVEFYGMSSHEAMERHYGVKDYRAAEGKKVLVPYKGPIENTVREILGGIRSAMTYIGARKLKEIPKRTTFVRVNRRNG